MSVKTLYEQCLAATYKLPGVIAEDIVTAIRAEERAKMSRGWLVETIIQNRQSEGIHSYSGIFICDKEQLAEELYKDDIFRKEIETRRSNWNYPTDRDSVIHHIEENFAYHAMPIGPILHFVD